MSNSVALVVDEAHAGARLDAYLAEQLPLYSRVQLRRAINAKHVTVDGERTKAAYRLRPGQTVLATLPDAQCEGPVPEEIPLDILYEDEALAAINKPAGMVVHPAKGHWKGTLTSALAFHFQNLSSAGGPTRPGVVHRLDRDTSGVILIAKSDRAHLHLAAQFEARTVEKEYFALCAGTLDRDRDVIELPIGLHPTHREKMAILPHDARARAARTFYEVAERFRGFLALCVLPKTGRTHQIRVHLAHAGCPVLADKLYGGRSLITLGDVAGTSDETPLLNRQALHAMRIEIEHPLTGKRMEFKAPLAEDMEQTLAALRKFRSR